METYIIRVYRNNGTQLAGLVESVEDGSQRPFRGIEMLTSVLEQATGHGGCTGYACNADTAGLPHEAPHRAAAL